MGVSFQATGVFNGYVINFMGLPPVVVEVTDNSPEEFEKVLQALADGFLKSRGLN